MKTDWRQAAVGCYWVRDDWSIETVSCGNSRWYRLLHNRKLVGDYDTFEEAERAAGFWS